MFYLKLLTILKLCYKWCKCLLDRSNNESFSRGILSEESFERGKKRSIISLKICFIGWLYELIAIATSVFSTALNKIGFPNVYLPDVIIMFVVIPLVHLMNDEETKEIIYNGNWYHGIRHVFGGHIEPRLLPSSIPKLRQQSNQIATARKTVPRYRRYSFSTVISLKSLTLHKTLNLRQRSNSLRDPVMMQKQ